MVSCIFSLDMYGRCDNSGGYPSILGISWEITASLPTRAVALQWNLTHNDRVHKSWYRVDTARASVLNIGLHLVHQQILRDLLLVLRKYGLSIGCWHQNDQKYFIVIYIIIYNQNVQLCWFRTFDSDSGRGF